MKFPILYKRSNSQDHINQWQIEVEGNKYRSTSGFVNMKLFTGDWTECEAKNVGKKNATTPEEQALTEAQSIHDKRKSLGYWENIDDCDKKVYFQPMTAKEYNDRKKFIKFPILSQPKLDGVRCIVKADGMWSRNGKPLLSAPHIFEELKPVFAQYSEAIFDGELFTSNKDVDFNTIISCVRKTKPTKEDLELSKQYIEFHMYDLPTCVGEDEPFEDRYFNLGVIFDAYFHPRIQSQIKLVPTFELISHNNIIKQIGDYLNQGYEGQMLRDPNSLYQNKKSTGLIKHKMFCDEEFTCIGYKEGKGKLSGKIGTLIFEGFESAVNGNHKFLEELWEKRESLIGKQITVKFFEYTTDNIPRFPKVVEIRDYE